MNKLELEMNENLLKFQIELVEDLIKTCRRCIRLNRLIMILGVFTVSCTTYLSVRYMRDGRLFLAIFELLLALFNSYLGVATIYRNYKDKASLKWAKCELEKIESEIESLKEVEIE